MQRYFRNDILATGLLVFFIAIAFFAIMNHVGRMVFGSGDTDNSIPVDTKSLPTSCKITLVIAVIPVIVLGVYIPGTLQKLIALATRVIGG